MSARQKIARRIEMMKLTVLATRTMKKQMEENAYYMVLGWQDLAQ
jgi:predicted thioesterase